MSDIRVAHKALLGRILEGAGKASSFDRRGAFDLNGLTGPVRILVDKVAGDASGITDEDITHVRASGFSEDQVFEIVVCAAIGQANRQYGAALAALKAAAGEE